MNKLCQSFLHDPNLVYTRKEDEDAAALGKKRAVAFVGPAAKTTTNNCCIKKIKIKKKEKKPEEFFSKRAWILRPPFHQNSESDQWLHRTSPLKCEAHRHSVGPPVEHTQKSSHQPLTWTWRESDKENCQRLFHRQWKKLDVVHVKLVDAVRVSVHLEHVGREHSALDHWAEVLCKLFAVDGRWHEDDLRVRRGCYLWKSGTVKLLQRSTWLSLRPATCTCLDIRRV